MKCTDVFEGHFRVGVGVGRGKEVTWEDLSMEEFITSEENFHERSAGFSSIIKKNNEKMFFFFNCK